MLERISTMEDSSEEHLPLMPRVRNTNDIHIEIKKTALEEVNDCIDMLRRSKRKEQASRSSPVLVGGLAAMTTAAAIIYAAIRFSQYVDNRGKQAELVDGYNNYTVYDNWRTKSDLYGVCGEAHPLVNVCDFKKIRPADDSCCADHDLQTYKLWRLAWDCYFQARSRCLWPSDHGVEFQHESWWPIVVFILGGLIFVGGVAAMISYFCTDPKDKISDRGDNTRARLREISEKYSMTIPDNLTIKQALDMLDKKAEEVTRPARRRAFLSCGREPYKDTSSLYRFFHGDGSFLQPNGPVPKIAPREIKEMILDYAGLLAPKRR